MRPRHVPFTMTEHAWASIARRSDPGRSSPRRRGRKPREPEGSLEPIAGPSRRDGRRNRRLRRRRSGRPSLAVLTRRLRCRRTGGSRTAEGAGGRRRRRVRRRRDRGCRRNTAGKSGHQANHKHDGQAGSPSAGDRDRRRRLGPEHLSLLAVCVRSCQPVGRSGDVVIRGHQVGRGGGFGGVRDRNVLARRHAIIDTGRDCRVNLVGGSLRAQVVGESFDLAVIGAASPATSSCPTDSSSSSASAAPPSSPAANSSARRSGSSKSDGAWASRPRVRHDVLRR